MIQNNNKHDRNNAAEDLERVIDGLCAGWIEGEEYGELQNINTANCVTLEEVKEAMRCTFEFGLIKARKE